jgi:hypothetical protein
LRQQFELKEMEQLNMLLAEKRNRLLDLSSTLTTEEYNFIPPGFNNNIIWNIGHLLIFAENLLYERSGLPLPQHSISLASFNMGRRPDGYRERADIGIIRDLYLQSFNFFIRSLGESQGEETNSLARSGIQERLMQFLIFHEDQHYQRVTELIAALKTA